MQDLGANKVIINSYIKLKDRYHELCSGDIFIGMIAAKHLRGSILVDLLERGIRCFPSPLSQLLNSFKTAQALILKKWMLPHTLVIARRIDLIDAINQYNRAGIGPVVTKVDNLHCGHGIRKWDNIEILYSYIALSESSYPFVIQPYLEKFTDIRVIIVGDYIETYVRYNPDNFRMNISSGGSSYPYLLSKDKEKFCRTVIERGKFPFAHIDLQIAESGEYYLSEIALNGGLKGANISRKELDGKKKELLERLARELEKKGKDSY